MNLLPSCMCVYHTYGVSEESIRLPGPGVTVNWEPLCIFWQLNPGLLPEQVLLSCEPLLQLS